jgi:hypothetical protein
MKIAGFSTLSFTNSLEVNYFRQVADVVVPAGVTPDTIFLLLVHKTVKVKTGTELFWREEKRRNNC